MSESIEPLFNYTADDKRGHTVTVTITGGEWHHSLESAMDETTELLWRWGFGRDD